MVYVGFLTIVYVGLLLRMAVAEGADIAQGEILRKEGRFSLCGIRPHGGFGKASDCAQESQLDFPLYLSEIGESVRFRLRIILAACLKKVRLKSDGYTFGGGGFAANSRDLATCRYFVADAERVKMATFIQFSRAGSISR